jgi:hypothetical protein
MSLEKGLRAAVAALSVLGHAQTADAGKRVGLNREQPIAGEMQRSIEKTKPDIYVMPDDMESPPNPSIEVPSTPTPQLLDPFAEHPDEDFNVSPPPTHGSA